MSLQLRAQWSCSVGWGRPKRRPGPGRFGVSQLYCKAPIGSIAQQANGRLPAPRSSSDRFTDHQVLCSDGRKAILASRISPLMLPPCIFRGWRRLKEDRPHDVDVPPYGAVDPHRPGAGASRFRDAPMANVPLSHYRGFPRLLFRANRPSKWLLHRRALQRRNPRRRRGPPSFSKPTSGAKKCFSTYA